MTYRNSFEGNEKNAVQMHNSRKSAGLDELSRPLLRMMRVLEVTSTNVCEIK